MPTFHLQKLLLEVELQAHLHLFRPQCCQRMQNLARHRRPSEHPDQCANVGKGTGMDRKQPHLAEPTTKLAAALLEVQEDCVQVPGERALGQWARTACVTLQSWFLATRSSCVELATI